MPNFEFIIGFALVSYWLVYIIKVFLDNYLGCCCCTGVPHARFMYPSVQARTNKSQRQGFSGKDSRPSWEFQGRPLNLDRRNIGSDCGYPLNLVWDRRHSGAYYGHIDWDLLWHRYYLFRGWDRVRSWDNWWCARYFTLYELGNGFNCTCCSISIS